MASKITLSSVNGATAPYTLYVCDSNGNNCSVMATSPLSLPQDYTLSSFFDGAPSVMLKIIDSNNCEYFEILPCQSA
jgi:hypothetical protein